MKFEKKKEFGNKLVEILAYEYCITERIKWVVIETTGVCDVIHNVTSFAIHTDQICDS